MRWSLHPGVAVDCRVGPRHTPGRACRSAPPTTLALPATHRPPGIAPTIGRRLAESR